MSYREKQAFKYYRDGATAQASGNTSGGALSNRARQATGAVQACPLVQILDRIMFTALGGAVIYGWKENFSRSATTASSFLSRTSLGIVRRWSMSSSRLLICTATSSIGASGIQTHGLHTWVGLSLRGISQTMSSSSQPLRAHNNSSLIQVKLSLLASLLPYPALSVDYPLIYTQ